MSTTGRIPPLPRPERRGRDRLAPWAAGAAAVLSAHGGYGGRGGPGRDRSRSVQTDTTPDGNEAERVASIALFSLPDRITRGEIVGATSVVGLLATIRRRRAGSGRVPTSSLARLLNSPTPGSVRRRRRRPCHRSNERAVGGKPEDFRTREVGASRDGLVGPRPGEADEHVRISARGHGCRRRPCRRAGCG